jgi:hypothetical protein
MFIRVLFPLERWYPTPVNMQFNSAEISRK